MRFFSKIVTLCNIAFVVVVVSKLIQFEKSYNGNNNTIQPTNILIGTAAILFVVSIFFSIVFAILILIKRFRKQEINIPSFLVLFNVLMLPIQIWYFFFQ